MEEGEAHAITQATDSSSDKGLVREQKGEVAEDASSRTTNPEAAKKPPEDGHVRWSRLRLFNKVMQKSLEKFIEHSRFASSFRPLYKQNAHTMENIHKQFIEDLRKNIQEDISRLIEEGRLECKLEMLDKLERAAKNNPEPAWRPSGVPERDFCSFLMPYYQKQEAYMRYQLKKIRAENASLAQSVEAGREKITQTEKQISASVDEWKVSVAQFERLASSLGPADVFNV